MWLADGGADLGSNVASPWGLAAVLVFTLGSLGAIVLRSWLSKPEAKSVQPVAADSARQAVEEAKDIWRESILEPLQQDLEREKWARQESEARADRSSRLAEIKTVQCERLIAENAVLKRDLEECRRDRPS